MGRKECGPEGYRKSSGMGIRKKLKKSAHADISATQTESDRAFLRQLEGNMQLSAARNKRRRLRILASVGSLAVVCLITVAAVLPQWLGSGSDREELLASPMDDGADAPASSGEAGDAVTETWQEAIGFPLVLDGWSYEVEEQKMGPADGYYAFSLMRATPDGPVTMRMDVPFGGYSYDSFEFDGAVTITRGDFTLRYEETRTTSETGEALRVRGIVERGGEPCIYVTDFGGPDVRFDETMFALLGVPEEG